MNVEKTRVYESANSIITFWVKYFLINHKPILENFRAHLNIYFKFNASY